MHEPQYTDYSLDQLHDCLDHINPEKYPLRYEQLQQEIRLRSDSGEALTDPAFNEFAAVDIPVGLGFRAWWCFLWRMVIACLLCGLILFGIYAMNGVLHLLPIPALFAVELLCIVVVLGLAGTFIMMQVLSKRYDGYRIRVIRHQQNNILNEEGEHNENSDYRSHTRYRGSTPATGS